jgi:hypothetical protein
MFKQNLISKGIFLYVILKNNFFSWMILEIFFKTLITNNLLFKLLNFFVPYSFVGKRAKNLINSTFHFVQFMP